MDMPLLPPVDLATSRAATEAATRQLFNSQTLREAKEAAETFEAMFLAQLLNLPRSGQGWNKAHNGGRNRSPEWNKFMGRCIFICDSGT